MKINKLAIASMLAILPGLSIAGSESEPPKNQSQAAPLVASLIVKIKPGSSLMLDSSKVNVVELSKSAGTELKFKGKVGLSFHRFELTGARTEADVLAAKNRLLSDPAVISVDMDGWVTPQIINELGLLPELYPDDTFNEKSWGSQNFLYKSRLYDTQLTEALVQYKGAEKGVTVAVLDTGITANRDFKASILATINAVEGGTKPTEKTNPGSGCFAGHGTSTSGVIGATQGNGTGVVGVAPEANFLIARVIDECGGSLSGAAEALYWAVGGPSQWPKPPKVAQVINMSLGGQGECPAFLQEAITFANSKGALVVVATGNTYSGSVFRPANCKGVIPVGALNHTGGINGYSNYESGIYSVFAPGGTLYQRMPLLTFKQTADKAHTFGTGTSFATPVVAGVLAKLKGINPKVTQAQVMQGFKQTLPKPTVSLTALACNECGGALKAMDFLNHFKATAKRSEIEVALEQNQSQPAGAGSEVQSRLDSSSQEALPPGGGGGSMGIFGLLGLAGLMISFRNSSKD